MRAEMSKTPSRGPSSQLHLPAGFRFCPTDEELVVHYLCKKAASQPFSVPIIGEVELYKFDPWDLPDKALFGEKEWYFFSPRDRKYPNGSRPNRAAGCGFWKATGTDKPIGSLGGSKKVGVKKALVFYSGKAPKGVKTNWIMHEYRLAESAPKAGKRKGSLRMDDWVLCRIYKKSSSGQKVEKECSDDSSGLDEILDFLPEMEDNKLSLNIPTLHSVKESYAEEQVVRPSKNFYEEAQNSGHSDCTEVRDENLPLADGAIVTQFLLGDRGCGNSYRGCEESSQGGASSLELSHMSNENSRQQHSPPDSVLEDDSVESTFSSLPTFCSADQVTGSFAHPFYSFDSLPSPLGRFEKFSAFGGEDFFNLEV